MKDILNIKIKIDKHIDLAPTIMKEFISEYFENDVSSPYMNFSVKVKKNKINVIPAACHIDSTARVQTLSEDLIHLFID